MFEKLWKKDNHTGRVETCLCEHCQDIRHAYVRGYEDGYEDATEDNNG